MSTLTRKASAALESPIKATKHKSYRIAQTRPKKRARAPKQVEKNNFSAMKRTISLNKTVPLPTAHRVKNQRIDSLLPGIPRGNGTKRDPITIPLRVTANATNCLHCPVGIEHCACQEIDEVISSAIQRVYTSTGMRRTHAFGRHPLNSKSVLPVFVTRVLRLLQVSASDTFWDLGCGIGTVVMQAALQKGANAVGIDVQPENIDIARQTWDVVQSEWKRRYPEKKIGSVSFISDDMFRELEAIRDGEKTASCAKVYPTTVWMSNQLFTPHMNHQLAGLVTDIQSIRAVSAMLDLFPHERLGLTQKRNPAPYAKFPVMKDHMTQENALEWSATEERPFYIYTKKE